LIDIWEFLQSIVGNGFLALKWSTGVLGKETGALSFSHHSTTPQIGRRPKLQAISKMWIRVQGKARGGAQSRRGGMSILSRHATPPWGLRRIFEMACRLYFIPHAFLAEHGQDGEVDSLCFGHSRPMHHLQGIPGHVDPVPYGIDLIGLVGSLEKVDHVV
jgi:hypothetical protein